MSTAQLRDAGLSLDAVSRSPWLTSVTRGVWTVGHTGLGPRGALWVAHLATGGVISHQSAAWAWRLLPPHGAPIQVTTLGRGESRVGIRVHRSEDVPTAVLDGLPVTTVARTLADLPRQQLNRAIREARYLGVLRPGELTTSRVRRAYERISATPSHRTRSEFEHWFLRICDAYDLPQPLVNQLFDGKERDFRWEGHRLVVETDGGHHRWADDRRRDRELFVRTGHTTLRFTGEEPPADVARTVRLALSRLRIVE